MLHLDEVPLFNIAHLPWGKRNNLSRNPNYALVKKEPKRYTGRTSKVEPKPAKVRQK
jgi:hypothetical protein